MQIYRPDDKDEGDEKLHLPIPPLEELMVLDITPAQWGWEERPVGGPNSCILHMKMVPVVGESSL